MSSHRGSCAFLPRHSGAALPPLQSQGDRIWRLANASPRGCPEPFVLASHRTMQSHAIEPSLVSCLDGRVPPAASPAFQGEVRKKNTGDLQGECDGNYNARPCGGERKAAGAKTGGIREKNRRGTMEQADIRARADASPGSYRRRQIESPAAERRRAHKSKTRISAVAHPSAERTSKLKSAPVIPAALSKKVAILARMRSPAVNPQAPRRTGRPRRAAPPCC